MIAYSYDRSGENVLYQAAVALGTAVMGLYEVLRGPRDSREKERLMRNSRRNKQGLGACVGMSE